MELSLRARVRAGDPDAFGVLFDECPGGGSEVLSRAIVDRLGQRPGGG